MRLTFLYHPVDDLPKAIAFYRDQLGLDEAWREGDDTVAFKLPDSEIELMLDRINESSGAAYERGAFFMVDDLGAWIAAHPDVTLVAEPFDIPGGRAATLHDPSGNAIHLFDQSTAEEVTG